MHSAIQQQPQGPADVVVLGGGPVGAATARLLAADHRVVLVDAGEHLRAAHRAAGMLAPTSEFRTTEPEVHALALDAMGRWPGEAAALETETGIGLDLRTAGTLHVALGADDLARTTHLADAARAAGLEATPLDRRALRRAEPGLSRRVAGGVAVQGDHQVDPRRLVTALRASCAARGVRLVDDAGRLADDGSVVLADGCTLRAGVVVVCAGHRTDALLPGAVPPTGVRAVAGIVLRLHGTPTTPVPTHVLRGRVDDREVYLVPRTDGELVVGATSVERGTDERVPAGEVLDLLGDAAALYPGVREMHLAEALSGHRPTVATPGPLLREHALPGPDGPVRVVVSTGHGRHGVLLCHQAAADTAAAVRTSAPSVAPTPPARSSPSVPSTLEEAS